MFKYADEVVDTVINRSRRLLFLYLRVDLSHFYGVIFLRLSFRLVPARFTILLEAPVLVLDIFLLTLPGAVAVEGLDEGVLSATALSMLRVKKFFFPGISSFSHVAVLN